MSVTGVPGPTITINGVSCVEDDTQEVWDYTGSSTTMSYAYRTLRCNWAQRIGLIEFLVGGSQAIAGTPFYVSGQPYPDNINWTCQHVEPTGDGLRSVGPTGMIAYERAILKCKYMTPTWQFGNPLLIGTQELDFSADSVSFDQTNPAFKFSSDSKAVPPNLIGSLKTATTTFSITRYQVPTIPYSTIISLLDCVNSNTFYGAIAGQARFIGGRSTRNITIGGSYTWTINYIFSVVSSARAAGGGHNAAYRTQVGWAPYVDAASGNPFYASGNFNLLFNS